MSSAIGGQSGKTPLGIKTVDIRDFGASPSATDCAPAIQAAMDSLVLPSVVGTGGVNPSPSPGRVYVPSGVWTIRSPIWWDGDYIELHGEATPHATTISMAD